MLKSLLLGICASVFITACAQNSPNSANSNTPNDGKHFGTTVTADGAVIYDEVMAKMTTTDSLPMKVTGKVKEVCLKKGCWMTLVSEQPGYPEMRVTFKDYGFFVPLDSAGRTAKVEGLIKVAELSSETAKHYESEGAIVPRGKDGKPREVQLIASGLELRK